MMFVVDNPLQLPEYLVRIKACCPDPECPVRDQVYVGLARGDFAVGPFLMAATALVDQQCVANYTGTTYDRAWLQQSVRRWQS